MLCQFQGRKLSENNFKQSVYCIEESCLEPITQYHTYHTVSHSPPTLGLLPEPEYMGLQNNLDNGAEKTPYPERRNFLFGCTPAATYRVLVP